MIKHAGTKKFRHRLISATALARGLAVMVPVMVAGQATAQTAPTATYNIPAQDLTGALRQFAEASHLQLVDEANITDGKTSPGVAGRFTADEAARRLLAGTGLTFQIASGAIVVTSAVKRSGVALGNVVVQGADQLNGATAVNGINGSHDVEATEGTGSYTSGALSIVSKSPLSIRETPQSVSVLTSAQIADQNLTSVRQGLEQLPGLTIATTNAAINYQIVSRGFAITSFEFDGGAPITERQNYNPLINLAEYDSIQLIRGADGLFNGYGDPSGVVNLVRKKPLDHNQFTYEQDFGSYQNFREVADVTGPVAFDGHLRARVVLSEQDNNFYYKIANQHDFLGYGILEADLGSKTTISVGGSFNRDIALPSFGLPRYDNGDSLNLPISTCLCYAGDSYRTTTKEVFAIVEHHFNKDWFTKLNFTYNDQSIRTRVVEITGAVGRLSGAGTKAIADSDQAFPNQQTSIDYNLNGGFYIFGRKQSFVIGGSYSIDYSNVSSSSTTSLLINNVATSSVPINVFNFDGTAVDYHQFLTGTGSTNLQKAYQYGIYANIRLEPLKGLHFMVGDRFSGFTTYGFNVSSFGAFSGSSTSTQTKDHSHSTPNFSATYDLPAHFTVYGSYADIYQPQLTASRDALGNTVAPFPVPPITGVNEEGGIKWESANKKINASLAYYYIKQNNIKTFDSTTLQRFSFGLENITSKGVDFQVAGELVNGLQMSASYSYNDNQHATLNPTLNTTTLATSTTLSAVEPHHLVKLFATYRFDTDNWLKRLTIGGGLKYQSDAFYAGRICTSPSPTVSASGSSVCLVSTTPFNFVTKGYATANAQVQYQLTDHVNLSFAVNNLTDVKTYETSAFESTVTGNYYLTPRNFLLAIKTKW